MSSFTRRIERQVVKSRPHTDKYGREDVVNDPRAVFFMGRGSKLGTKNLKDKALIARLKREETRRSAAA